MLRIVFIFILFTIFGKLALSQIVPNNDMKFSATALNLGTIKEELGKVRLAFEFTNIGNRPIIINGVSTSCGCTVPTYSKEPIMPGQRSAISVVFDPEARPGFFDKKIIVVSDSRKKQNVLTITGRVTPRPLTISDKYPYNVGNGILASSSAIEFGQIPLGFRHTLSLDLYNDSDKEIKLSVPKNKPNIETSYYIANTILKPKQSTQLIVTIDIEKSVVHKIFQETIPININGNVTSSSNIKVNAVSIPYVSDNIKQGPTPAIYLPETYHHFLGVFESEKPIKEFIIENEGSAVLKLKQIMLSDKESIAYSISDIEIPPMQKAILKVQFKPNGKLGRFNGDIMIISNDPSFPLSEIRIAANVKENPNN